MQVTKINKTTDINYKGNTRNFKELSHLFDTDHRLGLLEKQNILGLEKAKNSRVLDELWSFFEGNLGFDIYKAYYAILDSNDEVNNSAKNALLALANGKSSSIITNLKSWNKTGSNSYKYGLKFIADLIQGCKDNDGNHDKKALKLLGEMETGGFDSLKIPVYINFCKGVGGKIDDNRLKILRDFISKGYHIHAGIIADIPNGKNEITSARINFFSHVAEKYKNKEYKPDCLTLLHEILKGTKDSGSDHEIKLLDEHFEELLNDDKSVKWGADYFKACNGKIYKDNIGKMLHYVIPALKDRGFDDVKFPPDLLKDQLGEITYHNIDESLKLITRYKFSNKFIEELTPVINETKIGSAYINLDLINFITNNVFYFRETQQIPYPVEMLKEVLRISKDKDGMIDWQVANDILKPVYLLFKRKGKELEKLGIKTRPENTEYNNYKEVYDECSLLETYIGVNKNNKSNFSEAQIKQLKKISEGKDGSERLVRILTGKPLDELVGKKNLYAANEILEVMENLNENGRLNADYFNAQINNYNSLFWAIIEAPNTEEENKETYLKVMKLLSGIKGLDYNQKDKFGISVLEKVINAEKKELLDIITNSSIKLNYYPELDWAYNGIQNNEFKEKVKNLDLRFIDLEQSAKLCSVKTFDRLKSQLDSPLCNKERVIKDLFDIVKEQKGTIEPPDVYVYHLLNEYGGYLHRDLFNEMATWQVQERLKKLV